MCQSGTGTTEYAMIGGKSMTVLVFLVLIKLVKENTEHYSNPAPRETLFPKVSLTGVQQPRFTFYRRCLQEII